jgi:hypothetical protein
LPQATRGRTARNYENTDDGYRREEPISSAT